MKQFIFTVVMMAIFLLHNPLAYAQLPQKQPASAKYDADEPKGWIGFAIGPCFPVGAIANTDPFATDAGLATTGIHLNLNIGYHITGPIGLSILFHSNTNKINDAAFERFLPLIVPAGYSGSFEAKPWYMNGLLAGPYFALPSSGATSVYIRGLIGLVDITNPQIAITISKPGYQSVTATTEAATFMGFCYSLGAGANIRLGKKVQLMLNMDFISASATIEGVKTSYSNGSAYRVNDRYKQPYSVINITGGIGYIIQ